MLGKKKGKKKKTLDEIIKENEGLVCENCRTPVPGNTNICPKCGLSPSIQTMTDVYKPGNVGRINKNDEKGE